MYTKITIDGKEYELKLTTKRAADLEDDLGYNPLKMFSTEFPKLKDMIQLVGHSITYDGDIYELLDKWFQENHSMSELMGICLDIMRTSGFIRTTESKN